MRTSVVARFTVEGFHHWPDAPESVGFLRERHRHLFHVEVAAAVTHANRDREFIEFGRDVCSLLHMKFGAPCEFGEWSCEAIATYILTSINAARVSVFEDGENGAEVVA